MGDADLQVEMKEQFYSRTFSRDVWEAIKKKVLKTEFFKSPFSRNHLESLRKLYL